MSEQPQDMDDPQIAEAVARLERLSDVPPEEHPEVYEDVHGTLHDALETAQTDDGERQAL